MMKIPYVLAVIAACILAVPRGGDGVACQELSEGRKNFYKLEGLFRKWEEGLFGSRKYHEGNLGKYLNSLVNREIETGYDYIVVSPGLVADGEVKCVLQFGSWLTLHGGIDIDSLKEAAGTDKSLMKRWWRSGVMVSVSGKVRRFSMDTVHTGGLDLYLYRVKLKRHTAKNSGKKD